LHRGRISKKFRTRNVLKENESLGIALVGGPFRHMSGGWTFLQLGDAGSKVELDLQFEFESRATDIIFGRFFENTCNSLIDSFTQRAAKIYAG
jgi:ribosome-associated toxin RatA of RatAB toxin-antitoxin module